jgi:hypothetical protein
VILDHASAGTLKAPLANQRPAIEQVLLQVQVVEFRRTRVAGWDLHIDAHRSSMGVCRASSQFTRIIDALMLFDGIAIGHAGNIVGNAACLAAVSMQLLLFRHLVLSLEG